MLLVAVPIIQINAYMELVKRLKMDIVSIDILANNIYKYMFCGKQGNTNITEFAVVDIGAFTSSICIFSKGVFL